MELAETRQPNSSLDKDNLRCGMGMRLFGKRN